MSRIPATVLFKLCVGLGGWLGFASLWGTPHATLPALDVAIFVLLSAGTKCLGVQVSPHVTHSLVGVIDLASLYVFGPLGGAIVAVISGSACRLLRFRQPGASWRHRSLDVLFSGGLNAVMIVLAGWSYVALGGVIPLREMNWRIFPAVVAASLAWFSTDHFGWALVHLLDGGRAGLRRFWSQVLPYSVYVELLPLPFAVLVGAAYLYLAPPVLVLMLLAILGVGLILRELMLSLVEERRHVRELSTFNALGRSLLEAGPNQAAICESVYQHCRQIVDSPTFVLQIQSRRDGEVRTPVAVIDGAPLAGTHADVGMGPYDWMRPAPQELLFPDLHVEAPSFAPLRSAHPVRSALYVPLHVQEGLIGLISLQSPQPYAFGEDDRKALALVASQAAMALHTAGLYRREQERSSQLIAIAEVSRKVAAILDLPTLLRETVALVHETFGYYHVSIFAVDAAKQRVTFRASSNPSIQVRGTVVPWGEGLIGQAAASGDCLLVNDVLHDPTFVADSGLEETRSELVVPLKVEQRVMGVLDLQSNQEGAFGEQDLFVMQALADQVAIAVEDSRLYRAQQEQAWVATALFQAAEAVSQLGSSEDILATIVRLVPLLTGVERCLVFLCQDEDRFITVDGAGWSREELGALTSQPLQPHAIPLLERVRHEGQVLHAPCHELLDFLPPPMAVGVLGEQLLAIPLRAKGEVIGVLVALEPAQDDRRIGHRETVLTGIANQAAMALDNARMYASQREEAWVSTALLQVATVISEEPTLDGILAAVVRLMPLLVGLDWSAVLLWDEEREAFFGARQHGLGPRAETLLTQYYRPEDLRLLGAIQASTQPITLQSADINDNLTAEIAQALHTSFLAAVPLRARDKLMGVLVGGLTGEGKSISGRRMGIFSGTAYQIALSIESYQLYQQTLAQERLQREIELARGIQQSFLPECCPETPGWELAMAYHAARGVGGDYYDYIHLDDHRLGLVIADVSDKGVAAALYMALSRTVMRAAAISTTGAAQTLEQMNRLLLEDARSGMFVSVFYAILDLEAGTLTCARAGHNPPLLVRMDGSTSLVMPPGAVLGIMDDPGLGEERIQMAPGDVLVMYTDGVIEAINEAEQEFGEERLQAIVSGASGGSAEACVRHVDAAVRAFTGERPQFDDLTLLVLKREASAAAQRTA
ncbi:MAG: SpoIIE family protein phosphatase [Anaerolineae bacterium]